VKRRLVFLYDSTIEPRHVNLQAIFTALEQLETLGVECQILDTRDMSEEDLEYWRGEAMKAAIGHQQRIRPIFGTRKQGGLPYLGKEVPALLMYREGEEKPAAVYPHIKKWRRKRWDFSIEDFLNKLIDFISTPAPIPPRPRRPRRRSRATQTED